MINNKVVSIILPAYNCESTLEDVISEIPNDIVDNIILVDDCSFDNTVKKAESLGIKWIIKHENNLGYGGNQKTCYNKALSLGSDIIIMLHPDYQYTPKLIHSMAYIIANNLYPVVFGSRILGGGAKKGGMPLYKYIANRFLTLYQNIILRKKLSEYHTGYRAFSKNVLEKIPYNDNSNDFIFDNEMILQIFNKDFDICEITCPTKYSNDSSSISLNNSMKYGCSIIVNTIKYFLHKNHLYKYNLLK